LPEYVQELCLWHEIGHIILEENNTFESCPETCPKDCSEIKADDYALSKMEKNEGLRAINFILKYTDEAHRFCLDRRFAFQMRNG
jgi:hypothetical protein